MVEEPPMATCSVDGEPLVATLEFTGKEWVCVVCSRTYTFFGPKPAKATEELNARYTELKAQWNEEREKRKRK